jgi:hypothetical protein
MSGKIAVPVRFSELIPRSSPWRPGVLARSRSPEIRRVEGPDGHLLKNIPCMLTTLAAFRKSRGSNLPRRFTFLFLSTVLRGIHRRKPTPEKPTLPRGLKPGDLRRMELGQSDGLAVRMAEQT